MGSVSNNCPTFSEVLHSKSRVPKVCVLTPCALWHFHWGISLWHVSCGSSYLFSWVPQPLAQGPVPLRGLLGIGPTGHGQEATGLRVHTLPGSPTMLLAHHHHTWQCVGDIFPCNQSLAPKKNVEGHCYIGSHKISQNQWHSNLMRVLQPVTNQA